ncbi:2-(5''-triphosphoribosyl)-3'-dephospho-CoA synthase [Geotalea uraniireducens]|uniref:triphosphoribosyl-dephospho-CoA synthase n=1 Tax=Geotalea uraniireducens TaxID=351604 RepID=A0ABM8EN36_9BACT|nr:triphosphoribosyl-dephospho-CoA synthase [Geotalea uraniireducens]BDV44010.1 2-(5''-triphosphoribosyl)-3'-dephospho-CoA synthase [Geotalea uraniireducens]
MNSAQLFEIELFAQSLVKGAALGLYLTPKPGLVDMADAGAHPDLTLAKMEHSLEIIDDYLAELIRSLSDGERLLCQAVVGRRAEQVMLEECGTNTLKGYIFLSGLLLIARWHAGANNQERLRQTVARLAEEYFAIRGEEETNGRTARRRFRTGGIVQEALAGLPALFDCAVPAYLEGIGRFGCFTTASFFMLARLMQTVEDTTTLHRGGTMGLARLRRDGQSLERAITGQGDVIGLLTVLNDEYVRMNLTMGGVGDLLCLAYGYLTASGQLMGDAGGAHRSKPQISRRRCLAGN